MADTKFTCMPSRKTVHVARLALMHIHDRAAEIEAIAKAARSWASEDVISEDDQLALFRVVQRNAKEITHELVALDELSQTLHGESVAPASEASNA